MENVIKGSQNIVEYLKISQFVCYFFGDGKEHNMQGISH